MLTQPCTTETEQVTLILTKKMLLEIETEKKNLRYSADQASSEERERLGWIVFIESDNFLSKCFWYYNGGPEMVVRLLSIKVAGIFQTFSFLPSV